VELKEKLQRKTIKMKLTGCMCPIPNYPLISMCKIRISSSSFHSTLKIIYKFIVYMIFKGCVLGVNFSSKMYKFVVFIY